MACVCSRYNACSDWLILGHYFPIMPIGQLQTHETKAKTHIIINKLLTWNVRSLMVNPNLGMINMARSWFEIFL